MNFMAGNMRKVLHELTENNNKINTILSSMQESVIAVDMNERIMSLNHAAIRLFRIKEGWQERFFYEVIRHPDVQRFCRRLMDDKKDIELEIEIYDEKNIVLQAEGQCSKTPREGSSARSSS